MPAEMRDRFTPTAVGLVSRAWVINEVERRIHDPTQRPAVVEDLVGFEPPRRHGLRNMFLFWLGAIAMSAFAGALGLPRWGGFVVAVLVFVWIARQLATRGLQWRLDQIVGGAPLGEPLESAAGDG